ncbi:SemiSWEET transporter [Galbibacter sp. EGI 63066]|uniref:SemiSWEET family sugar transporter n=1 Tax=Galbibacter sp. EGI 63066 TaxID=2993559 RepID=UPI002248D8BD|nr:SemiSWEET transporter [Galbibacter sp. EGI 63066]MCX2678832.1 SemiSWEET transporter [Galbibacter sp. EGI 63066]
MMEIDLIEILGLIAAFLTTSAFVPQVYKAWKWKNVEGLSLGMYLAFLTGVLLWLVYGFLIQSLAIIVANIVTAILVMTVLILIVKHKKTNDTP